MSHRPTLRMFSTENDWVAYLQQMLAERGYGPGAADGAFGARTHAAVEAFQRDVGVEADGVVGPRTWASLHGEPVPAPSYRTYNAQRAEYEREKQAHEAEVRWATAAQTVYETSGSYANQADDGYHHQPSSGGEDDDGRTWAETGGNVSEGVHKIVYGVVPGGDVIDGALTAFGYDPRAFGEDMGENFDQLQAADTTEEHVAAGAGIVYDVAHPYPMDPIRDYAVELAGFEPRDTEKEFEQDAVDLYKEVAESDYELDPEMLEA
jgi:lysozyme family protein